MKKYKLRPLLAAAISMCALLAVGAGPASATGWSGTSMKWSTSVTLKKAGASPVVCTFPASQYSSLGPGDPSWLLQTSLSCAGGSTVSPLILAGVATGTQLQLLQQSFTMSSPYGQWRQDVDSTAAWVNGTSTFNPSRVTFNNTVLGHMTSPPFSAISFTGTLSATTSTGGLLTYTP